MEAYVPEPAPIPRIVPALLSFTAGFVDACTFLALFGLFVAQVTGSFVVVGAEFVTHDEGVLIKVLAIPVFFGAGFVTTIFAELLRRRGRRALAWTLAAECVLLAAFQVLGLLAPFRHEPNAPPTIAAALLGLSAMGVQSAAVRLLMPGVASTNVMTTNTTLFAIDAGELLLGWHGKRKSAEAAAEYSAACERLAILVPIGIGFIVGSVAGAYGYVWFGLRCLTLILVTLIGLVIWAARR
jgi:uncharacterized membrane protein YoaK (UPF0700 family)